MAIDKIDLSLDDIIKQNKKGGSAKRGGGNFQNKNKSKFGGTYEGGVGQRRNQRGKSQMMVIFVPATVLRIVESLPSTF